LGHFRPGDVPLLFPRLRPLKLRKHLALPQLRQATAGRRIPPAADWIIRQVVAVDRAIILLSKGIRLIGYKVLERQFTPDGQVIPLGVTLEKQ
jgi:hypothetical protein